jgi:hypothetical protein
MESHSRTRTRGPKPTASHGSPNRGPVHVAVRGGSVVIEIRRAFHFCRRGGCLQLALPSGYCLAIAVKYSIVIYSTHG